MSLAAEKKSKREEKAAKAEATATRSAINEMKSARGDRVKPRRRARTYLCHA